MLRHGVPSLGAGDRSTSHPTEDQGPGSVHPVGPSFDRAGQQVSRSPC
jgi:hypothetical protein